MLTMNSDCNDVPMRHMIMVSNLAMSCLGVKSPNPMVVTVIITSHKESAKVNSLF